MADSPAPVPARGIWRMPWPLLLDVGLVVVFAALGRASHAEESALVGALSTAAPFLVGLGVGWGLVRGGSKQWPVSVAHGITVWASTLVLGMVIRVVIGAGTAWSFILVAGAVLAFFLLGWRWLAQRSR